MKTLETPRRIGIKWLREGDTLRNSALWFPDVPPDELDLNQNHISSELSPDPRLYQPLIWIQFGGRDGQKLQNLIKIEVLFDDIWPFQILFHYESEDKRPAPPVQLGYLPCWLHPSHASTWSHRTEFAIDGPGGEMITDIDLLYNPSPGCKQPKNGGRSFKDMTFNTIQVRYTQAGLNTTLLTKRSTHLPTC